MNKSFKLIIVLLLLGILGSGFYFYEKNLKGAWPAIQKPAEDIAELIEDQEIAPLKLPDGFSISIYAKDLGAPRVMAWGPDGLILVSIPSDGKVLALEDTDGDGKIDKTHIVAQNLKNPHGLTTRCRESCQLYIAEEDKVMAYDYDNATHQALNPKKIADLPAGGRHTTRTLMFMPFPEEDRLLISIGSSCDVCHEEDERRAAIYSVNADGTDFKLFAKGLRNSVFMTLHPVDGKVWATDMGRDLLGDELPPDEINIVEEGKNYGWPICYGQNIHDTAFDKNTYIRNPCMEPFEMPAKIDLPAHSAPLGIAFIPEEGWPEQWWHNALIAHHGSWNRTTPTGYKIVRLKLDAQGNYTGTEDFITGWLTADGKALGRPVDLLVQPGGTIFISDDKAGVIYRVSRNSL